MFKAIISLKVNLPQRLVKITYSHPENPSEELAFKIVQDQFDLIVLKDFLSACFPAANFDILSKTKAKQYGRFIYQAAARVWTKKTAEVVLEKIAGECYAK